MEYATAGRRVTFVTIPGSYSGYPWAEHGRNVNQTYSLSLQRKWLDDASTMHFCNSAAKFAHSVSAVSRGRTDIPGVRAGESWGAGGVAQVYLRNVTRTGVWLFEVREHVKNYQSWVGLNIQILPWNFFSLLRSFQSSKNVIASKELDNTRQFAVGELLIIVGGQMPSWWQFCSLGDNWVQQLPSSCRH